MHNNNAKPPLVLINNILFIGLPLAALVLVQGWGYYHG